MFEPHFLCIVVTVIFWRACGLKVGKVFRFTCKIVILEKYIVKMSLGKNEFFRNGAQTRVKF